MTLKVSNVSLTVGGKVLLQDISFEVKAGQVFAIMGKSGCGKSSLLGFIAGSLSRSFSTSGRILLNGEDVTEHPSYQRRIGIQLQDHLLFPHMTVGENLAFGIPACYRRKERKYRVEKALADCGLQGCSKYNPETLSGGQKARISLMRSLLAEPAALLMDEPFSKLDSELRQGFSSFVYQQVREKAIMAILVTHDKQDTYDTSQILSL